MPQLPDLLQDLWPYLLGVANVAIALAASAHVILNKRDVRAAIGWAGLVWLSPFVGALLYLFLGVNRIQRRAGELRGRGTLGPSGYWRVPGGAAEPTLLPEASPALRTLSGLVERATARSLVPGNLVEPLQDGDEAYPAMLDAIDGARRTVALGTYILDNDLVGRRFVEALARAVRRGVAVRVLVDDVGAKYSRPSILAALRAAGVPVARFLPTLFPFAHTYFNLRNHRKLLVVDGALGFTGGMNVRASCARGPDGHLGTQDLHFRVRGPVVRTLLETFADDWAFAAGARLDGDGWFPPLEPAGPVACRPIPDGPDEDFDNARWVLLGALGAAQRHVRIVTPYFLPDQALITALGLCALRGVEVDILLPARGNLRVVQWAATAQLWQVLQRGCRVWLTPEPFDHTKLMVVDGAWALIGSANWDPRSLRLNFEFNLECYDPALGARLEALALAKRGMARRLTLPEVNRRPLPVKLRDGLAWLASPYL